MNDTTHLYTVEEFDVALVKDTLKDVCLALEERGYNSTNQLVGYLMSGDPGYISSYKDARKKLSKLDRSKVLEVLLKEFNEISGN